MTPEEYVQLKAFARQDGALMAVLWIGSFACYILGLTNPLMGMVALGLLFVSPFFAASRLRHFREYARSGVISFMRGYAYTIMMFFYGGLLLAAALYIYFAYMDQGYLMGIITDVFSSPEGKQTVEAYGMGKQIEEGMRTMSEMSPIDYSLNALSLTILSGLTLGLPIAAVLRRQPLRRI